VISEKIETPVEALQERILKLEQDLARVQGEIQSVKESLAEVANPVQETGVALTRKERIAKAKSEIFTEYDSLLSELAK
jgi:prefoldin subunit 5